MKVLTISGLALRRMFRDRTAMFFVLLLPFFIILLVGSATKNFANSTVPIAYTTSSAGPHTDELVRTLEHAKRLRVTRVEDAEKMRRLLRRGVYSAGVVIPSDYERSVTHGKAVNIDFIADQARPPTAVRASVDAAIAQEGALLQAANFTARHSELGFARSLAAARSVTGLMKPVTVRTETIGRAPKHTFVITGFDYTAPSQLVLFIFITSLAGSGILIMNRQQGITRRMYSTPTTARMIVAGETLARFTIAAFQALFIIVLGIVIFGVDFGDPLAAAVLTLMFVLVSTSVAVLAGTVFRTPEQAGAVGPALGIAIGMLGGCMWPRFLMPPAMQHLGQLFPHAWAMDGFVRVLAGAKIGGILPQLAVLAAFVIALLPLATWRLRRSIVG